MQILEGEGKHSLMINDDDEGFAEDGIQVMVLTGAEFEDLLVSLPIAKGEALLDKFYGANFKYHCNIMHYSNKSETLCQGCGKVLQLTNKEDWAVVCREAEVDRLVTIAAIHALLGTDTKVTYFEESKDVN